MAQIPHFLEEMRQWGPQSEQEGGQGQAAAHGQKLKTLKLPSLKGIPESRHQSLTETFDDRAKSSWPQALERKGLKCEHTRDSGAQVGSQWTALCDSSHPKEQVEQSHVSEMNQAQPPSQRLQQSMGSQLHC